MEHTILFSAVGDVMPVRRIVRDSREMQELRERLMGADVRMMNLEGTVVADADGVSPSAVSGGDWAGLKPACLTDLEWLGFNAVCAANNHSMDFMHAGVEKTIQYLNRTELVWGGIGTNLFEAQRPRYIETKGGRVAMICFTTTCKDWHRAGEQRRDMIGRPGVYQIRFEKIHNVSAEKLEMLRGIVQETDINQLRPGRSDGILKVGDELFREGAGGSFSRLLSSDAEELRALIRQASYMADVVVVSAHSHEFKGRDWHEPADFQTELARFCIDQGADAYVGHGPHVLRGVEIYKNKPIFYSLGDFFYPCEQFDRAPQEFYDRFGGLGQKAGTYEGYTYRLENGGMFGVLNEDCYIGALAEFSFTGKKLGEINLVPYELQFSYNGPQKGMPIRAHGEKALRILRQLQKLSEGYHTEINIDDQNEIGRVLL